MKKTILVLVMTVYLFSSALCTGETFFSFPPTSESTNILEMFMTASSIDEIREEVLANGGYYNGDKRRGDEKEYYFSKVSINGVKISRLTVTTLEHRPCGFYGIIGEDIDAEQWLTTVKNSSWMPDDWEIELTVQDNGIGAIVIVPENIDIGKYKERYRATAIPSPTPRPASYPVEFQEVKGYNDGNYSYVEGYAKNISDTSIAYALIRVTFLDESGKNVRDIGSTYVGSISKLRPGDREYFSIMVKSVGKDWRYRTELESYH